MPVKVRKPTGLKLRDVEVRILNLSRLHLGYRCLNSSLLDLEGERSLGGEFGKHVRNGCEVLKCTVSPSNSHILTALDRVPGEQGPWGFLLGFPPGPQWLLAVA